jgi:ABC-type cobalamin/Fe3+-siderophores transport system ATPase subunit
MEYVMTLIADKLTLAYQGNIIIESTSLTIQKGKITCLIGPNGCGKSTLLRALSGIHKPIKGQVSLDSQNLIQWPAKKLAQRLALLPQHPVSPESISVQQLVSHGRYPHQGLFCYNSQQDLEAVEWALEMTQMTTLRNRQFNTLSGGERQRGWIALALVQQSDILLLDEPTTYLDIGHQMEVLDLLANLNQQHQLTLVMVLHDVNQASQYAHRLLAMKQGKLIADGAPRDVISASLLHQLFDIDTEVIYRQDNDRTYPFSIPIRTRNKYV